MMQKKNKEKKNDEKKNVHFGRSTVHTTCAIGALTANEKLFIYTLF